MYNKTYAKVLTNVVAGVKKTAADDGVQQELFDKYYNEYMNRPQTAKTRRTGRNARILSAALMVPAATAVGSAWGGVFSDFKPGGIAAGAGIGLAGGGLLSYLLNNLTERALESGLDSEAWRYANLRAANAK